MIKTVSSRVLLTNLAKARFQLTTLGTNKRFFASEADPDDYGYHPDPIEHAWGRERKMIIARLMGDDRYEPKVYYRAEESTRDMPNLVPCHFDDKVVGCLCEPDTGYVNYWVIRKGNIKRCECGHWFKGIEADPESV